nr:hypothetical protein [Pandoravirus massiliensis]
MIDQSMDRMADGIAQAERHEMERLARRRRLVVIRWWPCWTVLPALLTALFVFVPWYAWDLAPDYRLADRARQGSCLVLAHGTALEVAGSDLVIPRLWVRLVADAAAADHNDNININNDNDNISIDSAMSIVIAHGVGVDAWAKPFFIERDSYMDAEDALAFVAASPVGACRVCFYDPAVPPGARVAMDSAMPSLLGRLYLAAWSAAVAAVLATAVCFGLVSWWAAL